MQQATKFLVPVAILAGLANAAIHIDELLNTYDRLPDQVPGAFVINLGFPLLALSAVVLAAALGAAYRFPKLTLPAIVANLGLHASALAGLILSRTGTVFGWTEPVWTDGANKTRIVEIVAIIVLTVLLAIEGKAFADRRQASSI